MLRLPIDDLAKQPILHQIATEFKKGKTYTEDEVNTVIKSFHVEDHELIRRELVDFKYMQKDSYRNMYTLIKDTLSLDDLTHIKHLQDKMREADIY